MQFLMAGPESPTRTTRKTQIRMLECSNELEILRKVAKLRKDGLWTRLKSSHQLMTSKGHWEYLLEEAKWMAKIFADERRNKEKISRNCSKLINSYFRAEEQKNRKLRKDDEIHRRKVSNQVAKLLRQFWTNVETVVHYKAHLISTLLDEKTLNEKLSKVLTRSEKYTEAIAQQLERTHPYGSIKSCRNGEHCVEEFISDDFYDNIFENEKADMDYVPETDVLSDEEDTIAQEEAKTNINANEYAKEIKELEDENNLNYDQLLAKYNGYLQNIGKTSTRSSCRVINWKDEARRQTPTIETRKQPVKGLKYLPKSRVCKNVKKIAPRYTVKKCDKELDVDLTNESFPCLDDIFSCENEVEIDEKRKLTRKIPSILLHELREYQYFGMDWLVSLYERNLNGILADEMGLGKTIQTIALLAYLAIAKANWGPHLVIVPTSLIVNWELEFLKWCPSLKILTYFGSAKERKFKRSGWYTPNSFNVCITSYTIAIQDQSCFRRRTWNYLILDEAHNIKNFKSQRWQVLLHFNTKHRLLLTGTPLQNSIMELWSMLHFLMPHVFESHSEFKEWFSKPITEITNGNREMCETIIQQLHKTLRPFILRRLKSEVEKEMPKKVEHVIRCSLSKRQRELYEEFVSRSDTKNTLSHGSLVSVLNVLMQLRKVCNHPDLFEPRPVLSSVKMEAVSYEIPKCIWDLNVDFSYKEGSLFDFGCKNVQLEDRCIPKFTYVPDRDVRLPYRTIGNLINLAVEEDYPPVCPRIPFKLGCFMGLVNTPLGLQQAYVFQNMLGFSEDKMDDESDTRHDDETFEHTLSDSDNLEEVNLSPTCSEGEGHVSHNSFCSLLDDSFEQNPVKFFHWYWYTRKAGDGSEFNGFDQGFYLNMKLKDRIAAVNFMNFVNVQRCRITPAVDPRLLDACSVIGKLSLSVRRFSKIRNKKKYWKLESSTDSFFRRGYSEIMTIKNIRFQNPSLLHHPEFKWKVTTALNSLIWSPEDVLSQLKVTKYLVYIPAVCLSDSLQDKSYKPSTAALQFRRLHAIDVLRRQLSKALAILHPIVLRMTTSFPDPRLVQYDCGKLHVLDRMLHELKSEGHKVLIFTQMSKMLDILEVFLNYHGHTFLRMDGSTKVQQRQLRVDKFNKDPKIFCFILSTRAGGIGINLTGADTVIFYDSDWNPTVDAQAQDRCHRIGQLRDVHIYRLISKNSVEENILKTSNQKRLIGEHAIEGGKFNMDYYKNLIKLNRSDTDSLSGGDEQPISTFDCMDEMSQETLENALMEAEDDIEDRQAVAAVMKDVKDDKEEFSEKTPIERAIANMERGKNEFLKVYNMLNPVERYALNVRDPSIKDWSPEFIKKFTKEMWNDLQNDADKIEENIATQENHDERELEPHTNGKITMNQTVAARQSLKSKKSKSSQCDRSIGSISLRSKRRILRSGSFVK